MPWYLYFNILNFELCVNTKNQVGSRIRIFSKNLPVKILIFKFSHPTQYEERLAEKDMVIMQKDLKIINYELNDYYRKKKSLEDQLQSLNDNIIKKEAEKSNLENQLNN